MDKKGILALTLRPYGVPDLPSSYTKKRKRWYVLVPREGAFLDIANSCRVLLSTAPAYLSFVNSSRIFVLLGPALA